MEKTPMKTPMYAVVTPSRPQKSRRVLWLALFVSLMGLMVAAITGYVEKQQIDRINALEETVLQMQLHMEQVLQFTHDYLEYEEDLEGHDNQGGLYEELTVRGVVRKKREVSDDGSTYDGVPIYEEAYGVNLNNRVHSERLRLYDSFSPDTGDSRSVSFETTESAIKPHHRVSNLWVSKKKRQPFPSASGPEFFSRLPVDRTGGLNTDDGGEDATAEIFVSKPARRHPPVMRRNSRVKATDPKDALPAVHNNVVPNTLTVVDQTPRLKDQLPGPTNVRQNIRKKRPGKKQTRRGRRRSRSAITLGHFVAAPLNRTGHHVFGGDIHNEWTPAAWMDKLGLNRKYTLRRGSVTVKESGLYYLYAQVLYQEGRFGTGYQIVVDDIPVMECTMTPSQPSNSCHTSGTTYLKRNAAVYIRDLESHMRSVRKEENSFFGLIKLMDAPESAEKLILG